MMVSNYASIENEEIVEMIGEESTARRRLSSFDDFTQDFGKCMEQDEQADVNGGVKPTK
jgi:hypothetical protein